MNELFKGLLFLHGYTRPVDTGDRHARQRFGARTAAEGFARPLGNRVASRQWFGAAAPGGRATPCPGACA